MSDVVERTLSALPALLGSQHPAAGPGRLPATSRLGSLIRSITALTSKHVRAGALLPPPSLSPHRGSGSPGLRLGGLRARRWMCPHIVGGCGAGRGTWVGISSGAPCLQQGAWLCPRW